MISQEELTRSWDIKNGEGDEAISAVAEQCQSIHGRFVEFLSVVFPLMLSPVLTMQEAGNLQEKTMNDLLKMNEGIYSAIKRLMPIMSLTFTSDIKRSIRGISNGLLKILRLLLLPFRRNPQRVYPRKCHHLQVLVEFLSSIPSHFSACCRSSWRIYFVFPSSRFTAIVSSCFPFPSSCQH